MKKQPLDKFDVVLIIEEQRRKRIQNFWQMFVAWIFVIIMIAIFVFLLYILISKLSNDMQEQNYEKLCSAKLQGVLNGIDYTFDECYLVANDDIENKDIATCSCYFYEITTNYPWYEHIRIEINLSNIL